MDSWNSHQSSVNLKHLKLISKMDYLDSRNNNKAREWKSESDKGERNKISESNYFPSFWCCREFRPFYLYWHKSRSTHLNCIHYVDEQQRCKRICRIEKCYREWKFFDIESIFDLSPCSEVLSRPGKLMTSNLVEKCKASTIHFT